MKRRKAKAVLVASDGAGGLTQIHDRRFEAADWPIHLVIEAQREADTWFRYLSSECTARGLGSGGMSQVDAKENSGSYAVSLGAREGEGS